MLRVFVSATLYLFCFITSSNAFYRCKMVGQGCSKDEDCCGYHKQFGRYGASCNTPGSKHDSSFLPWYYSNIWPWYHSHVSPWSHDSSSSYSYHSSSRPLRKRKEYYSSSTSSNLKQCTRCVLNRNPCESSAECCSQECSNFECVPKPEPAHKLNGEECSHENECISHTCKDGKCVTGSKNWPTQLFKGAEWGEPWPANTKDAEAKGWVKIVNEACVPELGEAWLFQGKRNSMRSVTLYFSPQHGGAPGVLTGIQADYYGPIMDGLVGRFFSEKKIDQDGNHYHSVAVGFRDSSKYNLCDKHLPTVHRKYMVIAPGMENLVVPMHENDDLKGNWYEGSCLPMMGLHYFKSAVAGNKDLTYKRNSVAPVSVMYHPDGPISGFFFWAPQKMQVWDDKICNPAMFTQDPQIKKDLKPTLDSCFSKMNFWDGGPGLNQNNVQPLFACANTCDEKCHFEDSNDGRITTMHFFFYNITTILCNDVKLCRNGVNLFAPKSG